MSYVEGMEEVGSGAVSVNPQAFIPTQDKVFSPVNSEKEKACIQFDIAARNRASHLAGAHGIVIFK